MNEPLPDDERRAARRAALDSRVRNTLLAAIRGDSTTYLTLLRSLMIDSHAAMDLLLISYGRVFCEMAIGAQGRELSELRLEEDILYAMED